MLAWAKFRRMSLRIESRHLPGIIALGFCLFAFNYLFFYHSERFMPSVLAAVVFSTVIATNMIFERILLGRRAQALTKLGALFGFAGILCIFWPEISKTEMSTNHAIGFLLAMTGTVLASLGNVLSAGFSQKNIPVFVQMSWGMTAGTFIQCLWILATGASLQIEASLSWVLALFYLAVFGSCLGFGCYLTMIQKIGAGKAAYAAVMFPVVALLPSMWLEDYAPDFWFFSGFMLIILGNILILRHRPANPDS